MSGEGGGAIVGGLLLVGALPYILVGVAIAGCAAGTVALGSAAVKAGLRHHERNKQLKVEQCSRELSELYRRMQAAMERQDSLSEQYYRTVERQMARLSLQFQEEGERDIGRLEEMIQQAKRESADAMGAVRLRELDRIHREAQLELSQIRNDLEAMQKTKLELLNWEAERSAARTQQEALAQNILRDAKATLKLLRTLVGSSREEEFLRQVDAMERSYQTAGAALETGAFQQAAAGGQWIISRGAGLALEHAQKQQEADEILAALEVRLEGLKAELEAQQVVSFEDEFYGPVKENLDEFTQGEFSVVLERIQALLDRVQGGEETPALLEQLLAEVENELVPHADQVVRIGMKKLLGYYERLHALQTISGYMRGQGYQISWVQPAGDDVTQELVVQFLEPVSGNTVSVALDEDVGAEDIGRMAMEVMFYYQNGRPLTENEKRFIREGMLDTLKSKGLNGALSCTGSVNQEAADKRLETAEAVQSIPPKLAFP